MKLRWLAGLVMGVTFLGIGAAPAHAGQSDPNNPTRLCVQDARAERSTCTQTCQDTFFASIDSCRNENHDCADIARATREGCVS
ncbi:MAG: hypothetical protein ACHQ6T_15065, partial [Myxococcota bacterium]